MSKEDRTFYILVYGKPTPTTLSKLSETEWGRFAILRWVEDFAKAYRSGNCSYNGKIADALKGWIPDSLEQPWSINEMEHLLFGLALFDGEDILNRYRNKYPTFDQEINDCFIDWICLAKEMFDE